MIEMYRYTCPEGHVNIRRRRTLDRWYCDTCKAPFDERRDLKNE